MDREDAQVHDVVTCSPQGIHSLLKRTPACRRGRGNAYPDAIRVHSVSFKGGEALTVGPDHAPLRLSCSEHEIDRAPRERHTLWEKRRAVSERVRVLAPACDRGGRAGPCYGGRRESDYTIEVEGRRGSGRERAPWSKYLGRRPTRRRVNALPNRACVGGTDCVLRCQFGSGR